MKASRFALPSGAKVELDAGPELVIDGVFAAELRGLHARFTSSTDQEISVEQIALSDFHSLRAILRKLGRVGERSLTIECRNCGHSFEVSPSSSLELGPFRDNELDDPELDKAFDFSAEHEFYLDGSICHIRLAPRTLAEALPLHRAIRPDRPLRVTSAVVRGMGIVEIDAETNAPKLARTIANLSDEAFDELAGLFESAHYPPRLDVPHRCPECGVNEWISVPLSRELALEPDPNQSPERAPLPDSFMSIDAFETLVRELAAEVWRELHVGEIDLAVIEDAAESDDSGEPLLGCYRPPEPDALVPKPAEIRIFYRTFSNMWNEEGAYDVRAEIDETLRHELEHHGGHLAGDDPLDDDEQAEIVHETRRRIGRAESDKRAVVAATGELGEFFRRTWPIWIIAFVATLLAVLARR